MPASSILAYLVKSFFASSLMLKHRVGRAAEGAQKSFGFAAILPQIAARRRQSGDDKINSFVREVGDNPVSPLFGDMEIGDDNGAALIEPLFKAAANSGMPPDWITVHVTAGLQFVFCRYSRTAKSEDEPNASRQASCRATPGHSRSPAGHDVKSRHIDHRAHEYQIAALRPLVTTLRAVGGRDRHLAREHRLRHRRRAGI